MGRSRKYKAASDQPSRICEISGQRYHADETTKNWKGQWVGEDNWDPRHPQQFVRGLVDRQHMPHPRPRQTRESELASNITATITATADLVTTVVSTDLGTINHIARVKLGATGDTLEVFGAANFFHSTDNVTFDELNDPIVNREMQVLATDGTQTEFAIGVRARYLQLRSVKPSVTGTVSVVDFDVIGEPTNTTSGSDL